MRTKNNLDIPFGLALAAAALTGPTIAQQTSASEPVGQRPSALRAP